MSDGTPPDQDTSTANSATHNPNCATGHDPDADAAVADVTGPTSTSMGRIPNDMRAVDAAGFGVDVLRTLMAP